MDPTAARSLFPLTKQFIFMNHAGVSPMSERAKAAIENLMEQLVTRPYPDGMAQEQAERLRQAIGRLVGARADTIGLVRSNADGLSLLVQGIDWRPGDNVVGVRGEHPANAHPWLGLRDRGVEYRQAEPAEGQVAPELVLSLVDERTRVVALSHVESWSGYRLDLASLGFELRRRGVIFAVDATQSAGAIRLELDALPVDFVCAAAYKWLLGPKGIGFCYCRPELLDRLRPAPLGLDEESSQPVLEMAAFGTAIGLFLDVGPARVEEQVLTLSRRLAAGLTECGYQVLGPWPRDDREASGIVSFRRHGSSAQEVLRDLNAAHVVGRTYGDLVRLSPHFYNTVEEVDHVLNVLAPGGVGVA